MSDTKAPESCPFCGAELWAMVNGKPVFDCGTDEVHGTRGEGCMQDERERLIRERDDASERLKRLEETGDRLLKYLRIAVGPDAAGWETPHGVDIGKRIEAAITGWRKAKEAKP